MKQVLSRFINLNFQKRSWNLKSTEELQETNRFESSVSICTEYQYSRSVTVAFIACAQPTVASVKKSRDVSLSHVPPGRLVGLSSEKCWCWKDVDGRNQRIGKRTLAWASRWWLESKNSSTHTKGIYIEINIYRNFPKNTFSKLIKCGVINFLKIWNQKCQNLKFHTT